MSKKNTIFLIGGTGLVGSYLLKVLLKNKHKVYVLARDNKGKSAYNRVKDILFFWDKKVLQDNKKRLTVFSGDITKKNLGLSKKRIDLLCKEVEEIFNSAASTKFNLTLKEIRKVNVKGTDNILKMAMIFQKKGVLKKVKHMSTTFVCGNYKGVFKEKYLDKGQNFNTTYEKSKFEAEKLVGKYREKGLWIDIFRFPLVVGESTTGRISTFNQSIYQLLRILSQGILEDFPVKNFFINIVSIDKLCESIYALNVNLAKNNNYHVFNCNPVPLEKITKFFCTILKIRKIRIISKVEYSKLDLTPTQRILLANNILAYNEKVKLDSKETNKILNELGFKFALFNKKYFSKILKFYIQEKMIKI